MIDRHGSREKAIHALINLWLKSPEKSCGYCGRTKDFQSCPDCKGVDMPLATNKQILCGFTQEMRQLRETRKNQYASTDSKALRFGVSIPSGLYQFLSNSFRNLYKENLFNKEFDLNWFMKRFGRYFAVPEKR